MTKNLTCGILIFLLALTILLVAIKENNDSSRAEDGLEIVEAEEASGPVDGINNTSIEAYTYDFLLYNGGTEEVYLDSVEPLFRKELSARVLTEDHKIVGNKTLKPHSSIHVKGNAEFNLSGLSKEQYLTLDHIQSVNVTVTKTLLFSKRGH